MAEKATVIGIHLKLSAAFIAVSLVIAGFVIGAVNMRIRDRREGFHPAREPSEFESRNFKPNR
jgi:hypothetical protein